MPHATLFLTFIVEKVGRSNTMVLIDHLKFNFFLLGNQLKILESCNRCERKYLLAWITTRTGLLRKIFSIYFPLFFFPRVLGMTLDLLLCSSRNISQTFTAFHQMKTSVLFLYFNLLQMSSYKSSTTYRCLYHHE